MFLAPLVLLPPSQFTLLGSSGHYGAISACVSHDKRYLLTSSWGDARLWSVDDGVLLKIYPDNDSTGGKIAWSPDESVFARLEGGPVSIIDVQSGKTVTTFGQPNDPFTITPNPPATIIDFAWDKDGKLVCAQQDGWVTEWAPGETKTAPIRHFDAYSLRGISPDGRYIASQSGIYESQTGKLLSGSPSVSLSTAAAAFSKDGVMFATMNQGQPSGNTCTVDVYSGAAFTKRKEFKFQTGEYSHPHTLAFSDDDQKVYVAANDKVLTCDCTGPGEPASFAVPPGDLAGIQQADEVVNLDGSRLLCLSLDSIPLILNVSGSQWTALGGQVDQVFPTTENGSVLTVVSSSGVAFMPSNNYFPPNSLLGILDSQLIFNLQSGRSRRFGDPPFLDEPAQKNSDFVSDATGYGTIVGGRTVLLAKSKGALSLYVGGTRVVGLSSDEKSVILWDRETGQQIQQIPVAAGAIALSKDDSLIATLDPYHKVDLWSGKDGSHVQVLGSLRDPKSIPLGPGGSLAFNAAVSRLVGSSGQVIAEWSLTNGGVIQKLFSDEAGPWVGFLDQDTLLYVSTHSGLRLLDPDTGLLKGLLQVERDGNWIFADAEGRFDLSDPSRPYPVSAISNANPRDHVPLDALLRDRYTPGLLASFWKHETFPTPPQLPSMNLILPSVGLRVVGAKGENALLEVTVRRGSIAGAPTTPTDLRIFRNGRLIQSEPGPLNLTSGIYRADLQIPLARDGKNSMNVSAYCFDQNRMKSETAALNLQIPKPELVVGRAYVITIGLDHYDHPGIDLEYSVADADAMLQTLTSQLSGFKDIIPVALTSDAHNHSATKQQIHHVFDVLAGRSKDPRVPQSTLDDLVILTWSGHGMTTTDGRFFLLPEDVASGDFKLKAVQDSCIGTDELVAWLQGVQFRDFGIILDTCHSAAVIESPDFRPGPLGKKSLGQFAYDEGIKVLAASQSAGTAVESGKIGHGLLTYTLLSCLDPLTEPLNFGLMNSPSLEGWMQYGFRQVPQVYHDLATGKLKGTRSPEVSATEDDQSQIPVLIDYDNRPTGLPFIKVKG